VGWRVTFVDAHCTRWPCFDPGRVANVSANDCFLSGFPPLEELYRRLLEAGREQEQMNLLSEQREHASRRWRRSSGRQRPDGGGQGSPSAIRLRRSKGTPSERGASPETSGASTLLPLRAVIASLPVRRPRVGGEDRGPGPRRAEDRARSGPPKEPSRAFGGRRTGSRASTPPQFRCTPEACARRRALGCVLSEDLKPGKARICFSPQDGFSKYTSACAHSLYDSLSYRKL